MQTTTTADTAAPAPRPGSSKRRGALAVPSTLDALLEAGPAALAALYAGARVPRIEDVKGDLRGRLLAIPSIGEPLAALPRALAGSSRFPWRGKSFRVDSSERGTGDNRVVVDRFHLFRFATFIDKSRAGDFDALQLDYDHPGNPFFIRAIKDEIRELLPGLYLGQAYLQLRGRAPKLALYFGLTRDA